MKENIHPQYVPSRAACACGSVFITKSTQGDFSVDVCGACHPFYTGTQKLIDTAGRIDRFRKRYGAAKATEAAAAPAPAPTKE
jgi:large subunit ribosomal protein L31